MGGGGEVFQLNITITLFWKKSLEMPPNVLPLMDEKMWICHQK